MPLATHSTFRFNMKNSYKIGIALIIALLGIYLFWNPLGKSRWEIYFSEPEKRPGWQ
jgi:hypothetical protein